MWDKLKARLPLNVKWASDGEEGKGVLYDMEISETHVEFVIKDSLDNKPFSMGSGREFLGANSDVNGLRISARYMGEIVVLLEKTMVVTLRVIDSAIHLPDSWTIPCGDCGELTWISSAWKNKKIDKVICKQCFFEKYKDGDYVACTNDEIIQNVLKALGDMGINVTKEEVLKKTGIKIGKEIHIK